MKSRRPIDQKTLDRILIMVIVVLAIAAGYFHSAWEAERKKYQRLEDLYVRVRGQLGREETQRLIDLSREAEGDNI